MKKHRDKTNSDEAEKKRGAKTSQKKPNIKSQGSNLTRKKHDLKTADKILFYMKEEEKF